MSSSGAGIDTWNFLVKFKMLIKLYIDAGQPSGVSLAQFARNMSDVSARADSSEDVPEGGNVISFQKAAREMRQSQAGKPRAGAHNIIFTEEELLMIEAFELLRPRFSGVKIDARKVEVSQDVLGAMPPEERELYVQMLSDMGEVAKSAEMRRAWNSARVLGIHRLEWSTWTLLGSAGFAAGLWMDKPVMAMTLLAGSLGGLLTTHCIGREPNSLPLRVGGACVGALLAGFAANWFVNQTHGQAPGYYSSEQRLGSHVERSLDFDPFA